MGLLREPPPRAWVRIAIAVVLAGLGASPAFAQPAGDAPFSDPRLPVPGSGSAAVAARVSAARAALDSGSPAIAASLLQQVAEGGTAALGRPALEESAVLLATARLALGDAPGARTALEQGGVDPTRPEARLRLAWALWLERASPSVLRAELAALPESSVARDDLPWRLLLEGLVAEQLGDPAGAAASLRRAREASGDPGFAAEIELQSARLRMRLGPATREDADSLLARVRANLGESTGFRTASLAALALEASGRRDEAVALLVQQLSLPGVDEDGAGDPLRILLAQLLGPETEPGARRLAEVLRGPARLERQREALALLARAAADEAGAAERFRSLLDELVSREPAPSLLDALLLERARLRLTQGDAAGAAADAAALGERVPGSPLVPEAEGIRAFVAVSAQPPRWRTAADLLARGRDRLPEGADRARVARLVADCFFLEGDHRVAAEAYQAVLRSGGVADRGEVVYQWVLALVLSGEREAAARSLDAVLAEGRIDDEWRWRAEWNVLAGFRAAGELEAARARLGRLLGGDLDSLAPALELRLRWLELDLGLASQGGAEGTARADRLLTLLAGETGDLRPEQVEVLAAHVRLLRARILLEAGRVDEGAAALVELRERHRGTESAVLSFLVEARHAVLSNRLDDAQRSLAALREAYPDSPFAPRALFESALILEQRGLGTTWQEALAILESLVQSYPSSPLVHDARLKQGDLLRRLGNFAAALQVYDGLITRDPGHPGRWRAELGRADTLFALAGQSPERLAATAAAYERLADLTSLPLDARIEASAKWASVLVRQRLEERAAAVSWLTLDRFLLSRRGDDELPGAVGRYWLARAAFDLGELRERAGQVSEAVTAYRVVVDAGLPGATAAAARVARLRPEGR